MVLLLSQHLDILEDERKTLYLCCENGHNNILSYLLGEYKMRNQFPTSAVLDKCLYLSCRLRKIECVKTLLEQDESLIHNSHNKMTPLSVASQHDFFEGVKLFIEMGAAVDELRHYDVYGCSPLYLASQGGFTNIVEILLE